MTPSSTAPGQDLVCLGPKYGSEVLASLNDSSAGDLPIGRIFSPNTAIPNYITVLLRLNVTAETYTGEMTVRETFPEFQISQVSPAFRYLYFSQKYPPIGISRYFKIWTESLVQMGLLSRRQVMLPTHQLTMTANYRSFSTLGFSDPSCPSEWLFLHPFFLYPLMPSVQRATGTS